MNPRHIIEKYYPRESPAYCILIEHSERVADKAVRIAERLRGFHPDTDFVRDAAMLHDIGILFTNEPRIACFGDKPYICHGYLGRELLEREGLWAHALVCERHVGVGISAEEIEAKNLPLPMRDMVPVSIEEKIICYADKFFSKDGHFLSREKPLERVRQEIMRYGPDKVERFDGWARLFGR